MTLRIKKTRRKKGSPGKKTMDGKNLSVSRVGSWPYGGRYRVNSRRDEADVKTEGACK